MSVDQEHVRMDGYRRIRLSEMQDEGCIHLLEAIVVRAAEDFMLGRAYELKHPGQTSALRVEVEQFFRSRWFHKLTGLHGGYVLRKLYKEAKEASMKQ